MNAVHFVGVPVDVRVELSSHDVETAARSDLAKELLQYARRLLDGLGLPVAPQVQIVPKKEGITKPSGFRVLINGKPARAEVRPDDRRRNPVDYLLSNLQAALVDNRLLFVTDATIREIQSLDVWNHPEIAALSDSEQRRLLETYLERCFRVGSGAWTSGRDGLRAQSARELFDRVTGDIRLPRVTVRYHADLCDPDETLGKASSDWQAALYYELGVLFPNVRWERDKRVPYGEFQIRVNDLLLPTARGLDPDTCLVNETPARLKSLKVNGDPAFHPINRMPCAVIDKADAGKCNDARLTTWDASDYMVLQLSAELMRKAGSVLTEGFLRYQLSTLREDSPRLVDTAMELYGVHRVNWILRALLDEGVSIGGLKGILDALILVNGTIQNDLGKHLVLLPAGANLVRSRLSGQQLAEVPAEDFADYVRIVSLGRYISHKYATGDNRLPCYWFVPEIEARVRRTVDSPLSDDERFALMEAIRAKVHNSGLGSATAVIMTACDVRREFRRLLSFEFPRLAVLCWEEIAPEIAIQPMARISLPAGWDRSNRAPSVETLGQ